MICMKYKKKIIGSVYYPSNKNTVVGFSGYFVKMWLPEPTTVIFIAGSISYTCECLTGSFSVVGAFSKSLS